MAETLLINNFKFGLDTRRTQQTSVPGVLITCQDGHVNNGAEIEKRKAFTLVGSLPPGCFGLQETPTTMYTFGSGPPPAQMPPGVTYQQLQHYIALINPSLLVDALPQMTGVVASCCLGGKSFVIATFGPGPLNGVPATTCLFYNGVAVRAFSAGLSFFQVGTSVALAQQFVDEFNYDPPAGFVVTLLLAPAPITNLPTMARVQITGPTNQSFVTVPSDTSTSANHATLFSTTPVATPTSAVAGSFSFFITGTFGEITEVIVPSPGGGTFNLLTTPVKFLTNLSITAGNIVSAINNSLGNQGYSAAYATIGSANQITVTAPTTFAAATLNGTTATVNTIGTGSLQVGLSATGIFAYTILPPFSGAKDPTPGAPQVDIIDFGPTNLQWNQGTGFTVVVTVNNIDYTYGLGNLAGLNPTYCMSLVQKVHILSGDQVAFSAIGDASRWEDQNGSGAGVITISDLSYSDIQQLTSCQNYQGLMAFISAFQIQIWSVGADPSSYAQRQVLNNIGSSFGFSSSTLGDLDVLFLADTGVRSLRVRDSSLNATTFDMGSAIDSLMQAAQLTPVGPVYAIVEPASGRYWLYINGLIYVLTYCTPLNIIAWSTYTPTWFSNGVQQTFQPVKFLVFQKRVYCLDSEGDIFLYGGPGNATFDQTQAVAELTWLDHGKPKLVKQSISLDAAVLGQWKVYASMDPVDYPLIYPNLPPDVVLENADQPTPNENMDSTYGWQTFPYAAVGTQVKFVAVSAAVAKPAVLGNLAWLYEPLDEK